jgi:hypothetical protein
MEKMESLDPKVYPGIWVAEVRLGKKVAKDHKGRRDLLDGLDLLVHLCMPMPCKDGSLQQVQRAQETSTKQMLFLRRRRMPLRLYQR